MSCVKEDTKDRRKTHLLLEVPPVLLVDEDEVEVISRAELLVHVAERRREVEATEEEPYWDRLAWRGGRVSITTSRLRSGMAVLFAERMHVCREKRR